MTARFGRRGGQGGSRGVDTGQRCALPRMRHRAHPSILVRAVNHPPQVNRCRRVPDGSPQARFCAIATIGPPSLANPHCPDNDPGPEPDNHEVGDHLTGDYQPRQL